MSTQHTTCTTSAASDIADDELDLDTYLARKKARRAASRAAMAAARKEASARRLPLVEAIEAYFTCTVCDRPVFVPALTKAVRENISDADFRAELTAITWRCRGQRHDDITRVTPRTWLLSLVTSLRPREEVFSLISAALNADPADGKLRAELDAALEDLVARGLLFQPTPNWVQPGPSARP